MFFFSGSKGKERNRVLVKRRERVVFFEDKKWLIRVTPFVARRLLRISELHAERVDPSIR